MIYLLNNKNPWIHKAIIDKYYSKIVGMDMNFFKKGIDEGERICLKMPEGSQRNKWFFNGVVSDNTNVYKPISLKEMLHMYEKDDGFIKQYKL